ncbi:MAG: MBL fold metallo-hydrolase [Burkholderiaceae bacterium]
MPTNMRVFERGWLSSNNILFHDNEQRATLVDTGYVSHGEQTHALVQGALGGRRLERIINTHLHSDHCGGNALLQQRFGARVLIPPGAADAVTRWDDDVLTFRATGQRCARFTHDGLVLPGQTLTLGGDAWKVLAAPGHDPHSIVLWNESARVLISADALWENGFGAIFPEIEGESGFAEQRSILALIEQLNPRWVIPGHGAPFTELGTALDRARARLAALEAKPERNARQVAKVLTKFILLDVRAIALDALVRHLESARYFRLVNDRYFRQPFEVFIARTVDELVTMGAASLVNGRVENRD